jgi:parvulin-like peptidyl-prolyl isomerase
MLPADVDLAPRGEVERLFGTVFADALPRLPLGQWSGPVASSFGAHVVLVRQREADRAPALEEVRGAVQRDLLADRKARQLEALYRELRERYHVVVEGDAK